MNEILRTAAAIKSQVMDARIHAVGDYADNVFYFKDLDVRAPVKTTAGDEEAETASKEAQDRFDDLYEAFLHMARSSILHSQGQSQPMLGRRLSVVPRSTSSVQEVGTDDSDGQTEVDLTFI